MSLACTHVFRVLCKTLGLPTFFLFFLQIQYCHGLLKYVKIHKGNTVSYMKVLKILKLIQYLVLARNVKVKHAQSRGDRGTVDQGAQ